MSFPSTVQGFFCRILISATQDSFLQGMEDMVDRKPNPNKVYERIP